MGFRWFVLAFFPLAIIAISSSFASENVSELHFPECAYPSPRLAGRLKVDKRPLKLTDVARKFYPKLSESSGGQWKPTECHSKIRVAILIPYRDRANHLSVLMRYLHGLLQRQLLDYGVFVVEQTAGSTFNRGKLLNIGFQRAQSEEFGGPWDCVVLHDVDMVPEDDRNWYGCPPKDGPREMAIALDHYHGVATNYTHMLKLYPNFFGGVNSFSSEQYKKVNGFSNDMWGWGGEDDDLLVRLKQNSFLNSTADVKFAKYTHLPNPTAERKNNPINPCSFAIRGNNEKKGRWQRDGLSNVDYQVKSIQRTALFTKLTVDLLETESRKMLTKEHLDPTLMCTECIMSPQFAKYLRENGVQNWSCHTVHKRR